MPSQQTKRKLVELFNDNDSDGIIDLVKSSPDAARKKYRFDDNNSRDEQYPFFHALKCEASLDVIKLLCEAHPEEIFFDPGLNGEDFCTRRNALHIACLAGKPSLEVLQFLLEEYCYPDTLEDWDILGRTPLHYACLQGAPIEVIRLLVHECPKTIKQKDINKTNPLHLACGVEGSLEAIRLFLDTCPEAAKERDILGRTPLHHACRAGAPLEVIRIVLDAYPEAIKGDYMGTTALNFACEGGSSLEVVRFLLDRFPDAITKTESDHLHAVHYACGAKASLEVVQFLLDEYLKVTNKEDREAEIPLLHHACRSGAPLEVVKFLVFSDPEAIRKVSDDGSTPLHCACSRGLRPEVVRFLLEADIDAIQKKNDFGKIPMTVFTEDCRLHADSEEFEEDSQLKSNEDLQEEILASLRSALSLVNLDEPSDEELCEIFNEFRTMAWWGGVMLLIDAHPSVIHKLGFDFSVMPDLLAKIGRVSKVGTFFEVLKGLPYMMKGVN